MSRRERGQIRSAGRWIFGPVIRSRRGGPRRPRRRAGCRSAAERRSPSSRSAAGAEAKLAPGGNGCPPGSRARRRRSAQGVTDIFTKRKLDAASLDDLEDVLIQADLGVAAAHRIREAVGRGRYEREIDPDEVKRDPRRRGRTRARAGGAPADDRLVEEARS